MIVSIIKIVSNASNSSILNGNSSNVAHFIFSRYEVIVEKAYYDIYGPIMAKKGRPLPAYEDVVFNASLMLGNSHVSLGQPTRLPQNYKAIGGYHVDTDVKPLPQVRFIHFKMRNFV